MDSQQQTEHAPRLFDLIRQTLRVKHYSMRTEQTYLHWIKRFILLKTSP